MRRTGSDGEEAEEWERGEGEESEDCKRRGGEEDWKRGDETEWGSAWGGEEA